MVDVFGKYFCLGGVRVSMGVGGGGGEKWCFCARSRNFAFFGKTNVQKEGGF